MSDNLPDQFTNIVDSLMRPAPPPPSATIRVADLFSADGGLGRAAEGAGFAVVYRDTVMKRPNFGSIPPFDIVTANMPDGDNERTDALEFVMRFLGVRKPETFLMMGRGWNTDGAAFLRDVRNETRPLGYTVTKTGIDNVVQHGFIIGALRAPRVSLPTEIDERPTPRGSRRNARSQPALPLPPVVERILRNLN